MEMDGNLKKIATFFKFSSCFLKKKKQKTKKKYQKNIAVYCSCQISFDMIIRNSEGTFCVQVRVLSNDFCTELT